jgi:hypothetical protein
MKRARKRLREVYERALSSTARGEANPRSAWLRRKLVGWLEGLFQGIQAAMVGSAHAGAGAGRGDAGAAA